MVIFVQRNNYRKQNRKYLRYFLHRKYYGSYMHLGGNGITTRSVEKKKSFEPPIQENCANKSRGDTLTQMLLAVICAELLPPVGFCLLSVIVLMDFEVCTKNLTVHVSDTSANKFATSLHVSDIFGFLCRYIYHHLPRHIILQHPYSAKKPEHRSIVQ